MSVALIFTAPPAPADCAAAALAAAAAALAAALVSLVEELFAYVCAELACVAAAICEADALFL